MRRRNFVGWLAGMCLLIPVMTWAGQVAMTSKDQRFVMMASEAQEAEIALSQMAIEGATSEKVKQYAQRVVDDHSKAGQELHKVAEAVGIPISDERSLARQKTAETFAKLSGKEFDRAYVNHEVKEHQKTIAEFKKQMKKIKDPQIRQWASGALPVLKEHLIIAKGVLASFKNGSNQRRK